MICSYSCNILRLLFVQHDFVGPTSSHGSSGLTGVHRQISCGHVIQFMFFLLGRIDGMATDIPRRGNSKFSILPVFSFSNN